MAGSSGPGKEIGERRGGATPRVRPVAVFNDVEGGVACSSDGQPEIACGGRRAGRTGHGLYVHSDRGPRSSRRPHRRGGPPGSERGGCVLERRRAIRPAPGLHRRGGGGRPALRAQCEARDERGRPGRREPAPRRHLLSAGKGGMRGAAGAQPGLPRRGGGDSAGRLDDADRAAPKIVPAPGRVRFELDLELEVASSNGSGRQEPLDSGRASPALVPRSSSGAPDHLQ